MITRTELERLFRLLPDEYRALAWRLLKIKEWNEYEQAIAENIVMIGYDYE